MQAVQYLEADVHPTRRQSRDGISHLLDGLAADFKLTKSERLQIVNLAPTSLVELHVVSLSSFFPARPRARAPARTALAAMHILSFLIPRDNAVAELGRQWRG